jgi:putative membrane protein
MKIRPTALLLLAAACATSAYAAAAKVSATDKMFFTKAAQAGMAEVEMGQLAQSQGSSDAVKTFGQQMVTDHGAANDELKTLAAQKGVTLPTKVAAADQSLINRLKKAKGMAFDHLYLQEAGVKDHTAAVSLFTKASKSKDADVKAFADKTLPTIQKHLDMAKQDVKDMGAAKKKM